MRSSGSPRAESISTGSSACSLRNCLSSSRPLPSGSITSSTTAAGACVARAWRALWPSWQARTVNPSWVSQLPSSSHSSWSSSISNSSLMTHSIQPLPTLSVSAAGKDTAECRQEGNCTTNHKPLLLVGEQALRGAGLEFLEGQLEALVLLA
ncbi:hypothetical protein D3C75_1063720 [compost metagenome]